MEVLDLFVNTHVFHTLVVFKVSCKTLCSLVGDSRGEYCLAEWSALAQLLDMGHWLVIERQEDKISSTHMFYLLFEYTHHCLVHTVSSY